VSDIADYYSNGHTDYSASDLAENDSRFPNVIRAVKSRVPMGARVLDVGCGDMYFARQLPDHEVTGLDLDETRAKNIVKWDLSKAPYPLADASFHGVICSEVLEHLWEPETCISEMARVLRPGGFIFVTVPNFDVIDARLEGHLHLLYRKENTFSVEHIRQYNPASLQALLKAAGFSAVSVQGNSPQLSGFFSDARETLHSILNQQFGARLPQLEVDVILGAMFPTILPGMLFVAKKGTS
jgi:2-polyprenyl-3-methyl-5-hydroxy-6-metoxy-1,4-benzoquinol methylase